MKVDTIEAQTPGGIYIPETHKEAHDRGQMTGTLIAVGRDCWKEDGPWAKVGDRVMYGKYTGDHLRGQDNQLYRLLNDTHITAIVADDLDLSDLNPREAYGG